MKEYNEEEFLMLSGLQHYVFCKRQWALIHLEQQWNENYLTTDGNILHEKAHDGTSFEKRKNILISRGMPVCSYELGISGICDIVEFHKDKEGISLHGQKDKYKVYPVEYKRGTVKETDADSLQVVAQALCLEEMLCCEITKGYLYYGEMRRRVEVAISNEQKDKAKELIQEMHRLYQSRYTPKVKATKACKACSLVGLCMPKVTSQKSVKKYIEKVLEEH
ncbi:MAG: CRISPR-associated protein Cas4 [Cellulosilyticaceae bacterium]